MAKNDDKERSDVAPAAQHVRPGDEAPQRLGAERRAEGDQPQDTGAVGTILVDASEVAKNDGDYYEAYVGVDEDRKRRPARDAQRPYWGEGEQEARRQADEEADREALRRSVFEREADAEEGAEQLEESRKAVRDERKRSRRGE